MYFIIHMRGNHAKYDLGQAKIFLHIRRGLRHKMGEFRLDNFPRSLQSDWLSAKILVILAAAPPLFLSLLFVDAAVDFGSWMFLSHIFCILMINMLWKARLWIINRLLDTLSINMGEISSSSLYFGSPKGSPKYGKTR